MRPAERGRVLRSGVVFHAFSVLILILIFRRHLEVVACAWGILALGDGSSTLFGRGLGGPRLPWNPAKTWAGSLAFLFFGGLGGAGLMVWVAGRYSDSPSTLHLLVMAAAAAFAGALVESLPLDLDDNLSVPFLTGALVYSLSAVDPGVWAGASGPLFRKFLVGLGFTLLLAAAAKWMRWVSGSGVAGGVAVGTVIATFAGMEGFAILALFFLLGSAATRLDFSGKLRKGIAQEAQGERGMVHAMANCSVPAFLAFLSASTSPSLAGALRLAFVASLATAACDTLGSEVGPLGKGDPFLITRLKRVPAGTPGAVSWLGTAAGVVAAFLLGSAAALLGAHSGMGDSSRGRGCPAGDSVESLLGATLEPMGLIGSETINFINTAAGGLSALALLRGSGGFVP